MIPIPQASPLASRSPSLAAIYIPQCCDAPREMLEEATQLVVATCERPLVQVVPPTKRLDTNPAPFDRVVLALAPLLLEGRASSLYAQESCDPYIYRIGHTLCCGFRVGRIPPPEYLESLAPGIADHLLHHYPVRSRRRERRGLAPDRLWRTLALIDERFAEALAVEDLASVAHLSPFHFARMFRRSTGQSPHAYITERRMEKAKVLLATTGEPIAKVAQAVGYRTQAHFTRVFHLTEGSTPRRYRRDHRLRLDRDA
jgi:AraC family transcriptional regulator